MSGGGFSTGWLSELSYITRGLSTCDSSKDQKVSNYLQQYSVAGRPYGHGFLATAYASYLAANGDMGKMAEGLDSILGHIKAGASFEDAIYAETKKTVAEIVNAINQGTDDATVFVRELAIATKAPDGSYGAGSVVLGHLSDGTQAMGLVPADGSTASDIQAVNTIFLQVGTEAGQQIDIPLFSIGTKSLGLHDTNILDAEQACRSIEATKSAVQVVSSIRSAYGAIQNRLEHTINNLNNVVENTTAAESSIRDTDMAKEMVKLSMQNVLEQAGLSMMAQANQSKQGVLTLLQ